ncbi:MAG: ATP-dependent RNA helicase RhlE [Akkermansiaceae bacterium]|jgi:ATP-dependent RNA helicase RhlE
MTPTTFEELALAAPLKRALAEQNYTVPSPIQAQSIPILLEGGDLMGIAQTGTGKTAAFSLPILNALHNDPRRPNRRSARVLVLTPTRELASQISQSFETYGKHIRFSKTLVFGGVGKNPQIRAMKQGVDVLVACPGRLLDHMNEGDIDLSSVEFFVLDEVDRMLDMGFLRDVKKIVAALPRKKQSLFFSATLAPNIKTLAGTILNNPAHVSIEPKQTTAEKVDQRICFVDKDDKKELLLQHLADQKDNGLTIIFSRTKHGANKLCKVINSHGFEAEAIHGNRSQPQRERTLEKFKAGRLPILVATDVAARGVDVKDVTLVINMDIPNEAEAYVHRIGRTGRAGAEGSAVSYCSPEEHEFFMDIEKLIKKTLVVDLDHPYHHEELADLHARGLKARESTRDNGSNKGGGGGRRGGGGGGGGGGNRGRQGQGQGGGGGQRQERGRVAGAGTGRRRRTR